jgi:hypothetical protein
MCRMFFEMFTSIQRSTTSVSFTKMKDHRHVPKHRYLNLVSPLRTLSLGGTLILSSRLSLDLKCSLPFKFTDQIFNAFLIYPICFTCLILSSFFDFTTVGLMKNTIYEDPQGAILHILLFLKSNMFS